MGGWNDDTVYASLEPSDAQLMVKTPNSQLLVDFPILSSALSNIFPYLLLLDNILGMATWTNDNPYQNCLFVVFYSVIVMYWQTVSYFALPMIFAISFLCVMWSVSSLIYDSKFNEKPTIDEVLHTLHNITVKFELSLRPLRNVLVQERNIIQMCFMSIILTPLQVFMVKTVISPQVFVWLLGLFLLTYHSAASFAIRRLLWRSLYVRYVAFYLTGITAKSHPRENVAIMSDTNFPTNFPTLCDRTDVDNSSPIEIIGDFSLVKSKRKSESYLEEIAVFEVLENERRWLGLGWSKLLMHGDRPRYCYLKSMTEIPPISNDQESFIFPTFENDLYSYKWKWLDTNWSIDTEFNKGKSTNGWVYYDNRWSNDSYKDGFSRYTRSRKWDRAALLQIQKKDVIYDE